MPITVTSKAASEILRVLDEQQLDKNETVLRVGVQGGCSGLSYSMTFDKQEDVNPLSDLIYTFDGLSVAVARKADASLDGVTVDFYDDEDRRGFTFDNPNKQGGCGGCSSGGCGA